MKDFRTYLKNKLNKQSIVGKAILTPPAVTEVLQSSSTLSVLDLLSEGPIEGLVTKDGKYADGLRLFESFYLDGIPVKQLEVLTPTAKDIPFDKIKNVSRLTTGSITNIIDNLISRLSGFANTTITTGTYLDIFEEGVFFRETDGNLEDQDYIDIENRFKWCMTGRFRGSGIDPDFRRTDQVSDDDSQMMACLFRPNRTDNFQFELKCDDGAYMFLGPAIEADSYAKVDMFFDPGHGTDRINGGLSDFDSENTEGTVITFDGSVEGANNAAGNGYTGRSRSGIMIRQGGDQGTTPSYNQTGLVSGRFYPVLVLHDDEVGNDEIALRFRVGTDAIDMDNDTATNSSNFKLHTEEAVGCEDNGGQAGRFYVRKTPGEHAFGRPLGDMQRGFPSDANGATRVVSDYNNGDFNTTFSFSQRFDGRLSPTGAIFNLIGLSEFGNISGNPNLITSLLAEKKIEQLQTFKNELIDFLKLNSGLARFGIAEYDVAGIFDANDLISGRNSFLKTAPITEITGELNPPESDRFYNWYYNETLKQSELDSTNSWSAGQGEASSTSMTNIELGTGNYVGMDFGSNKLLKGVVIQGRADADQWVSAFQVRGQVDGGDYEDFGFYSSQNRDRNTKHTVDFKNDRGESITRLARRIKIHPVQFEIHASMRCGAIEFLRAGESNPLDTAIPSLTTAFDFRNYLEQESGSQGLVPYKRQIRTEERKETINIPEDCHFVSPIVETGIQGSINQDGKVENMFQISDFIGGGFFFFEIGDNPTGFNNPGNQTYFKTGKFFVNTTTDAINGLPGQVANPKGITGQINSGITGNYDVFVFDRTGISLTSSTPTQVTPLKGDIDDAKLKIGFISDLNSVYNYTNVALDFRVGDEIQAVMDGYEQGKQDFRAGQKLLGPLKYGGTATGNPDDPGATGSAGGYSDERNAGDFSAWMSNPPLEHDFYPYTHVVERMEVDRIEPTIAIEVLLDTIDAGDDAGVNKPASLAVGMLYGFEGDVATPGTAGDDGLGRRDEISALLSGGNSISSIALSQYRKTTNKIFTSIVTNMYMTTITEVDDLPSPEVLKDARIDQATIPGLTNFHLTRFGLTSGELLYPNDSWRDVNRYMTIRKLSPETDSSLIQRSCSISYFTETIKENFIYPYGAIAGSAFDARTFNKQPSRQFDVRLKKVLIPSNYEPLNPDGSDKRFVTKSTLYGKRSIFKFDGTAGAGNRSTNFGVATKPIILGPHNFEISLKIKFGDVSSRRDRSYYLLDMQSVDAGSSNLNDGRLGLIQRGKTDDADNDTDVNPQLVLYSPNEGDTVIDIPAGLSTSIVYQIKIKRVGDKLTLSIHNYETGELIGESTDTGYSNDSTEYSVINETRLVIGAAFNLASVTSAGTQIADLIIKKNNEIINWWDGTIIKTLRRGIGEDSNASIALKDKVGGSHADLRNTPAGGGNFGSVVADEDFQFGKNKEVIYNGHWDGTFKLGWTDNPAWILYDLMINPMYGVGNNLDDREDINIFQLFEIARHCDAVDEDGLFDGVPDSTRGLEPRFSCNIRLAEPKNAYEILGNLGSVFRAISFWDGSSLTFNSDRDKPVSAIFNNGNVYDGFFNYADILSNARFTRVEVPYADAKDEYTMKIEYIEDEERIRQYGIITNKVNGIGCTSKSQARRLGKYIMLSNKLETEIVSFKVGHEGILLEPGDVIRIDDEIKNFEINYGRILEIETGAPGATPAYFDIEDQINTGSIITGTDVGGIYAYNSEPHTPLEELYDISTFNSQHTFGADDNIVTGKIPFETIRDHNQPRLSKFYITGFNKVPNALRLYLNRDDENFDSITGVRHGTFANVELNNNTTGEFKVVSIKPSEDNLYSIEALQYERRKFSMIESEDFDLEENNYNIGIPLHTVNKPSAPEFNFDIIETPNLTFSVTGNIIGAAGSNETEYRVTVLKTNRSAPYIQKTFMKDDVSSAEGTQFRINGLIDGSYSVRVTALQNPESSPSESKNFTIASPRQQYIKPLIQKINGDVNVSQTRLDGTGYGEVKSLSNDCTYNVDVVDVYGRNITISQSDFSINVYAKTGENYNLVQENQKRNQYTFTEVQNRLTYGQMNTGFELRFDLIQNEQTIDTSYYNTTII